MKLSIIARGAWRRLASQSGAILLLTSGWANQVAADPLETFLAEFWETPRVNSVDEALPYAQGAPDATFVPGLIDYPRGSLGTSVSSDTLATWLGPDSSTVSGNGAAIMETSIIRFYGYLELSPGSHTFSVTSDDGYRLSIDGQVVSENPGAKKFWAKTVTKDVGSGSLPFELLYFERASNAGIEFRIDGELAVAAPLADLVATKRVKVHRDDAQGCGAIPGTPDTSSAAIPGACMEYRIEVRNLGEGMSQGTGLIEHLDDTMIFRSARVSGFGTSDPSYSLDLPRSMADCASEDCTVRMKDAILGAGRTGTIVIRTILK